GPNGARGVSAIDGGVFHHEVPTSPIPLEDWLPFISASGNLTPFGELLHQPVMMKPVNGMSEIYESGFYPHVEDSLTFQAEVREIHQSDNGVEIVYLDKNSGDTHTVKADYCVSTLPLGVFVQLPKKDVSQDTLEAMRNLPYFPVGKIGL